MYHLQCIKGKRQGLSLLGTNVAKGRSQRSPMGQLLALRVIQGKSLPKQSYRWIP